MPELKLRRRLLLSTAAAAIGLAMPLQTQADDFVVDMPVFATNGGNVIDGNDVITVTGTGSITPPTDDFGINANGDNNTVFNHGVITTDQYGHGIRVFNFSAVHNSGAINTSYKYTYGILAGNNNAITNSGTITTNGDSTGNGIRAAHNNTVTNSGNIIILDRGYGIFVDNGNHVGNSGLIQAQGGAGIRVLNDNVLTNSGQIEVSGYGAGLRAGFRNTITNSGSIAAMGVNRLGIRAFSDNQITNSGTITTDGVYAVGISASFNNTVSNSGSVSTSGSEAYGIEAGGGNTVANSGSIATTGDDAHAINARDNNTVTNTGSITTTGLSTAGINAYENNVIANSGSITVSGDFGDGIRAFQYNSVSNSGSITTSGEYAYGIAVFNQNTVSNSGSIMTSAEYGYGIYGNDNNTIFNSGSIRTTGLYGDGIRVDDENTIVNSGTITTSGEGAYGIGSDDDNLITNSGVISTSGDDAYGLNVEDHNTVNNTGTISTSGDGAYGIYGVEDNVITNSGSITTSGAGAVGVAAISANTINNSGRIVSAQARSIDLDINNTLNLMAPAFLGGEINLGDQATVSIHSGPSHSILWDLSTGTMVGGMPTLSGPVPIFYNQATQQVATFDPTGFAGSANALADLAGNVSSLVRGRLSAPMTASGGSSQSLAAYVMPDETTVAERRIDQAFQQASSTYSPAGSGWWVSAFSSTSEYDGSGGALDQAFDHSGLAVGYDAVLGSDMTVGLLGGYGWGTSDANSRFANSFDNETGGFFAALYGQKRMAGRFVGLALAGGMLSHSDNRFVNDNLAPLGVSYARSSYDSWWLAPEIRAGVDFETGKWTYTPSAQLRYAMQSIDGYTEKGPSAANAKVASRSVGVLETRLEIAAARQLDFGTFTARAGWQNRSDTGDDSVRVTMIGQTRKVGYDSNTGNGYYFGADMNISLAGNLSLGLGAEMVFGDARTLRGVASLSSSF